MERSGSVMDVSKCSLITVTRDDVSPKKEQVKELGQSGRSMGWERLKMM